MIKQISAIVLLCCIQSITQAAFSVNQLGPKAALLLQSSIVPGRTIRQCSCDEEKICRDEMENQMNQCSDKCLENFQPIIANPFAMKPCLQQMSPILHGFIDCMENKLKACVPTKSGPQIPYHNIQAMFESGDKMMSQQRDKLLNEKLVSKMRPVAETALIYGACVKHCFTKEKNGNGFCFDRIGCQPNIQPAVLQSSLKSCGKLLNWKTHAGSLCTCAQKAGVRGLQDVCPLLSVMG